MLRPQSTCPSCANILSTSAANRLSKSFHDKVKGEIVNALLEGEDLVPYSDGKPVPNEKGGMYDREEAVAVAMRMIVRSKIPEKTPFDAVRELCRGALHSMLRDGEKLEDLMKSAQRAFKKAMDSKIKRAGQRHDDEVRDRLKKGR